MNHNKLIATGLILTIGVFLAAGCINGGKDVTDDRIGGTGEEKTTGEPIKNCQDLQDIQNDLSADYYLANDIDCSNTENWNNGKGFKPVGGYDNPFEGVFRGNGYKIKDLYIDRENTEYVGLFAALKNGANITDVYLEDIRVTGGSDVGALVGNNKGYILDSHSTGRVEGGSQVGGLLGTNNHKIHNSHSEASVKSSTVSGGLIGDNSGKVYSSYSTGYTEGSTAGGLVGVNTMVPKGSISNSYATGFVNGTGPTGATVGGLVGNNGGSISKSYSTTEVSGSEDLLPGSHGNNVMGGFVGYNKKSVDKKGYSICYDSFWNVETSNIESAVGKGNNKGIEGYESEKMKKKSTFTDAGWDFQNTWYMDGYPNLQWNN